MRSARSFPKVAQTSPMKGVAVSHWEGQPEGQGDDRPLVLRLEGKPQSCAPAAGPPAGPGLLALKGVDTTAQRGIVRSSRNAPSSSFSISG